MAATPVKTQPSSATAGESLEERLRRLIAVWRHETAYLSSTTEMVAHPAYQEIILLGPPVVPLLLRELENDPDHWAWALISLTGANPVAECDSGNLEKTARAWLDWGRAQGYRW